MIDAGPDFLGKQSLMPTSFQPRDNSRPFSFKEPDRRKRQTTLLWALIFGLATILSLALLTRLDAGSAMAGAVLADEIADRSR